MNIARIRDTNQGVPTVIHYIAVGLDDKDVYYLVMFEAPEDQFQSVWPLAQTMLNLFALGE